MNRGHAMDRDKRRAEYATRLKAEAEQRFGADRAKVLEPMIDDTAGFMAEVAAFPVDADDAPAFYAEPAS
jgi:hypothetical protein